MLQNLKNYSELISMVGREPNEAEFLSWAYLGVEPDWYKRLVKEI